MANMDRSVELKIEEFKMSRGPFEKELFYSSCLDSPPWVDDIIKRIQKEQERQYMKMLVDVLKYEIKHDDIFSSVPYVLSGDYIRPFAIVKLDKDEKETNKMEAKKCDRCGKLYEQNEDRPSVRFKFKEVYGAEDLNEAAIAKRQLQEVHIKAYSTELDLCPECKESFKKWWESDDKK